MKPGNPDLIRIQPASPLEDLRKAPAPARYAVSYFGAALGAYVLCFGTFAVLGIWRGTLLSILQISIVVFGLALQGLIAWACKIRPLAGGFIFGLTWAVPIALVVLKAAGPSDAIQAIILVLMPLLLSLANGIFAGRILRGLDLPLRRGESS